MRLEEQFDIELPDEMLQRKSFSSIATIDSVVTRLTRAGRAHMNVSTGLDAAILAVSRTAADHADDVDRASRIPEEAVRALQTQAMMGLLVPAALGGPGRSMSQVAVGVPRARRNPAARRR